MHHNSIANKILKCFFEIKTDKKYKIYKFCGIKLITTKIQKDIDYNKIQATYQTIIERIKVSAQTNKIKVLFLINDISKWKTQSLYNLLKQNDQYEPIIALTIADRQNDLSKPQKEELLKTNFEYFKAKDIDCVVAYDTQNENGIDLSTYSPDIVFYQQPYSLSENQHPARVGQYALTCYMPYYVPNYLITKLYLLEFHEFLYKYYQPCEEWCKILNKYRKTRYNNIDGLGHTMLDEIYFAKQKNNEEKYVIYAPHWSVKHKNNKNPENYSTFLHNYKEILEYAQKHPEFDWIFKPHPTLKHILISNNIMPKEEVENYYEEWNKIAKCCLNSDYIDLFMNSKTLITDCGSFLIEYFATEKPLIHLISKDCKRVPPKFIQKIYNSFYKVHNTKELFKTLDELLNKNNDYKKNSRLKILNEHQWLNCNTAQKILTDFNKTFELTNK